MKGIKKISDKIIFEAYFKPKKREEYKRKALELQRAMLVNSEEFKKPVTKKEQEEYHLATSMLHFSIKLLELAETGEKFQKDTTFVNSRFHLLKKEKELVFKAFIETLGGDKRVSFFHFPSGIPKKTRKKAFIHKHEFDLNGFKITDEGTFKQKVLNFKEITLSFKGKKEKYNLLLEMIGHDNKEFWVKNLTSL